MMLVNQMHGSFNDIEDVLTFAKDIFLQWLLSLWLELLAKKLEWLRSF